MTASGRARAAPLWLLAAAAALLVAAAEAAATVRGCVHVGDGEPVAVRRLHERHR
jgi:hypothetical protein